MDDDDGWMMGGCNKISCFSRISFLYNLCLFQRKIFEVCLCSFGAAIITCQDYRRSPRLFITSQWECLLLRTVSSAGDLGPCRAARARSTIGRLIGAAAAEDRRFPRLMERLGTDADRSAARRVPDSSRQATLIGAERQICGHFMEKFWNRVAADNF